MIRSKLMKAILLGVGMAAFTTNVAFAQMAATTAAPATKGEALSDDQIALFSKQKDIDQYLFTDHADEIKAKSFVVNYTGVTGDAVEIGISPYNKENADYLYGIFGTDGVSVVEAADNIMYANSTGTAEAGVGYAEPGVVVGTAIDGSATTLPEGAVSFGAGSSASDTSVGAPDAGAAVNDGQVQIQIESTDAAKAADSEVVDDANVVYDKSGTDIRTVAAAENQAAVPATEGKDSGAVDTSLIVLAIAGGAVVIGGGVMAARKKK